MQYLQCYYAFVFFISINCLPAIDEKKAQETSQYIDSVISHVIKKETVNYITHLTQKLQMC